MDVSQGKRVAVCVVGVDAESGEEESAVEQQEAGAIHVHQSGGWKRKRVREKPKNMSVQYKMKHRLGSFQFECHSIFKYFFIPKCVIWCGKHKNDNHFLEKPIIKCLICILVSEIA